MRVMMLPSFYPTPRRPGTGIFVQRQAEAVAAAGAEVTVVYCEERSLRELRPSALRETHFQTVLDQEGPLRVLRAKGWNPITRSWLGGHAWGALTRRLVREAVRQLGRPDVIHAQNAMWAGAAALRLAKQLDVPLVLTEHSDPSLLPVSPRSHAIAAAYQEADVILTISQHLARSVATLAPGRPIDVVPNLVDTDLFTLPATPRPTDRPALLCVAHLEDHKGIHLLLDALAQPGLERATLEIAGAGPQGPALRAQVARLGLSARVRFLGALAHERVPEAMWRANLFVLPSLTETFGIVLIEAMATGLPIVATRCGGPEEFVTPDVGTMAPIGDAVALAEAIRQAWSSRARFSADRSRQSTAEKFGARLVAARLLEVYAEAVARRKVS